MSFKIVPVLEKIYILPFLFYVGKEVGGKVETDEIVKQRDSWAARGQPSEPDKQVSSQDSALISCSILTNFLALLSLCSIEMTHIPETPAPRANPQCGGHH